MLLSKSQVSQPCYTCNCIQELPAIFCWMCGAPLMRISKWFVTLFMSVTAAAYGIYGLYADTVFSVWPIPLYLYYVFIFVCMSLIITRRYYWISLRVILWSVLLLYAMTFLGLSTSRLLDTFVSDLVEIRETVRQSGLAISLLAAALTFNLVLGFVMLAYRFDFTLAYRIFLTFLAAAAYAVGLMLRAPSVGEPMKLSSLALWLPNMTVSSFLGMTAVNLVRVLVAEMIVYSVAMSFAPANARFREVSEKLFAQNNRSGVQSPLLQGSTQVSHSIVRAGIYLQYFFKILSNTVARYALGMYRVIRRLMIDLVTPVTTLAIVVFLLGVIAEHTAAYLTGDTGEKLVYIPWLKSPLAMIGCSIVGVMILQMIFLAAVTKFKWRDLWRCNALLVLWIGPFFFALFAFVSLSLVATGTILKQLGNESLPFHIGPLTIFAIVALIIMLVFSLLYPSLGRKAAAAAQARLMLTAPSAASDDKQKRIQ